MDARNHRHGFELDPLLIGLFGIMAGAMVVMIYHCIIVRFANRRPELDPPPTTSRSYLEESDAPSSVPVPIIARVQLSGVARNGKEEHKDDMCAVCLCEFYNGEVVRVLPECMHYFHAACVDMWLISHGNCPLCRASIEPPPHVVLSVIDSSDAPAPELGGAAVQGSLAPSDP